MAALGVAFMGKEVSRSVAYLACVYYTPLASGYFCLSIDRLVDQEDSLS